MEIDLDNIHHGIYGVAYPMVYNSEEIETYKLQASVKTYIIDAPGQSPLWDRYLLGIVHLRDVPGAPAAIKRYETATHELILAALNPQFNPSLTDLSTWKPLTPLNFVAQVPLLGDKEAETLVDLAAQAVVEGILWAEPPLSGQLEPWDSSIRKTVQHLNQGHHL